MEAGVTAPNEMPRILFDRFSHDDVISVDELVWLGVLHDDPELAFWLAPRAGVPDVVRMVIATAGDVFARRRLAERPDLSDRVREMLASDPDPIVRENLRLSGPLPEPVFDSGTAAGADANDIPESRRATTHVASTAKELQRILGTDVPRDDDIVADELVWLGALRNDPDLAWAIAHRRDSPEMARLVVAATGDWRSRLRLEMRRRLEDTVRALLEYRPTA